MAKLSIIEDFFILFVRAFSQKVIDNVTDIQVFFIFHIYSSIVFPLFDRYLHSLEHDSSIRILWLIKWYLKRHKKTKLKWRTLEGKLMIFTHSRAAIQVRF